MWYEKTVNFDLFQILYLYFMSNTKNIKVLQKKILNLIQFFCMYNFGNQF